MLDWLLGSSVLALTEETLWARWAGQVAVKSDSPMDTHVYANAEGGGETHDAFLEAGVVDRVALFLAPLLLGGRQAPGVLGGAGRELKSAVRLGPVSVTTLGDDLLLEADVVKAPR